MKYFQWIGALACVAVIIACYMPWMQVPGTETVLTGLDPAGSRFGRPGKAHIFFAGIAAILFLVPRIWAKRTNIFVCAFALAWAVRNYILYSRCEMGICPEKREGLLLLLVASSVAMMASLLPSVSSRR